MNIKGKLPDIIKWIIALILLLVCIHYYLLSYGSFTSNGALRDSEINDKETIMDYSIDSSKMFIFYWDSDNKGGNLVSLSGFDKDNNLVYIYKYPR